MVYSLGKPDKEICDTCEINHTCGRESSRIFGIGNFGLKKEVQTFCGTNDFYIDEPITLSTLVKLTVKIKKEEDRTQAKIFIKKMLDERDKK